MTENEFQNVLVITYFLMEQGKFKEALSVLMLATEFYSDNLEYNRMLTTLFYLQKEYKKCSVMFQKYPKMAQEDKLFQQLEKICSKLGGKK